MTEAEWQASVDPEAMLKHLGAKASERKLRLFACACCRRIWDMVESWYHDLCEVAERYADGQAEEDEVEEAIDAASDPDWVAGLAFEEAASLDGYPEAAIDAADNAAYAAAAHVVIDLADDDPAFIKARQDEQAAQCQLLRDVVGNPFHPPTIDPAWKNRTVLRLAKGIYQEQSFADLPVLADALEEAGCNSAEILQHCRGGGPHVRGCWVVDLILGKE